MADMAEGLGFSDQGLRFRVSGSGAWDLGFRVV